MQTFKQWLNQYSNWTHILAFATFLVGAFNFVPQFHDLIMLWYEKIPPSVQGIIVTGFALYAWYRKGEPKPSETPISTKVLPGVAIVVLFLSMFVTGCIAQSKIAGLTNILGNAASTIASLEGNSSLATKLKTDTSVAVTDINNWKSGTPAQDVIQALNTVEDDLNLIPGTSQYAPLVDLAIGTVESILELLPQSTTMSTLQAHKMSIHASHPNVNSQNAPKDKAEFKRQWNAIVASNPQLSQASLK